MENQPKRKRGAPLGNRNAVKHGYYAKHLNHAQKLDYAKAVDVSGLDEEIALVRVAVKNAAIGGDMKNLKPLLRSVNTLDKLIRTRYRVGQDKNDRFKEAVAGVINDVFIPLGVDVGNSCLTRKIMQTQTNGNQSLSNGKQSL
jgi:hypothetical protein